MWRLNVCLIFEVAVVIANYKNLVVNPPLPFFFYLAPWGHILPVILDWGLIEERGLWIENPQFLIKNPQHIHVGAYSLNTSGLQGAY
jgi:hypothetical protein